MNLSGRNSRLPEGPWVLINHPKGGGGTEDDRGSRGGVGKHTEELMALSV